LVVSENEKYREKNHPVGTVPIFNRRILETEAEIFESQ
jgi:hypothetical protein